ncbi:hypothetical protein YB2330_003322 [Saitoella coloradoensis]
MRDQHSLKRIPSGLKHFRAPSPSPSIRTNMFTEARSRLTDTKGKLLDMPNCNIYLDKPSFTLDEEITGIVNVDLVGAFNPKAADVAVKVQLRGMSKAGSKEVEFVAHEFMLHPVSAGPGSAGPRPLAIGELHTMPFTFTLPSLMLPPTLRTDRAAVSYVVKAICYRNKLMSIAKKQKEVIPVLIKPPRMNPLEPIVEKEIQVYGGVEGAFIRLAHPPSLTPSSDRGSHRLLLAYDPGHILVRNFNLTLTCVLTTQADSARNVTEYHLPYAVTSDDRSKGQAEVTFDVPMNVEQTINLRNITRVYKFRVALEVDVATWSGRPGGMKKVEIEFAINVYGQHIPFALPTNFNPFERRGTATSLGFYSASSLSGPPSPAASGTGRLAKKSSSSSLRTTSTWNKTPSSPLEQYFPDFNAGSVSPRVNISSRRKINLPPVVEDFTCVHPAQTSPLQGTFLKAKRSLQSPQAFTSHSKASSPHSSPDMERPGSKLRPRRSLDLTTLFSSLGHEKTSLSGKQDAFTLISPGPSAHNTFREKSTGNGDRVLPYKSSPRTPPSFPPPPVPPPRMGSPLLPSLPAHTKSNRPPTGLGILTVPQASGERLPGLPALSASSGSDGSSFVMTAETPATEHGPSTAVESVPMPILGFVPRAKVEIKTAAVLTAPKRRSVYIQEVEDEAVAFNGSAGSHSKAESADSVDEWRIVVEQALEYDIDLLQAESLAL